MSAVGTRNPLMSGSNAPGASASDLEAIQKLGAARKKLEEEIAKVVIGQEHIVDDLLTALFARGHCLMIGEPRDIELKGIRIKDRLVMVYSKNDMVTHLKLVSDPFGNGYDADTCRKMAVNVVSYAMQN